MAELNNIFLSSSSEEISGSIDDGSVDIEWLDFEYINNCTDLNRLKSIYSVLKSGKEGHYPEVCNLLFFIPSFISNFFFMYLVDKRSR